LLDREKRVIGVLAGQPFEDNWTDACNRAFTALDRLAQRAVPSTKDIESHHGIFPTIAYGISLGNGQKVLSMFYLLYT